jgi:hypothetical protein
MQNAFWFGSDDDKFFVEQVNYDYGIVWEATESIIVKQYDGLSLTEAIQIADSRNGNSNVSVAIYA